MSPRFEVASAKAVAEDELQPGDLVLMPAAVASDLDIGIVFGSSRSTSRMIVYSSGNGPRAIQCSLLRSSGFVRVTQAPTLGLRVSAPVVERPGAFSGLALHVGFDTSGPYAILQSGELADVDVYDLARFERERDTDRIRYAEHWYAQWELLWVDAFGAESAILRSPPGA